MFYVYIIYSEKIDGYYCGQTNDIANRIKEHNAGETNSIKKGVPWMLVGYLVFETRTESVNKERQIKGRGIKRWLEYSRNELVLAG